MEVDARLVARVIVGVGLMALAAVAVVLFLTGAQKNAQISDLRQHGVPVEATVSGCLGLMGGSGSNLAGYSCRGTFTITGHRYDEAIPGNTLYPPGTRLRVMTVPGDPALLDTVGAVRSEHPSFGVFVIPTTMVAILGLTLGALVLRRQLSRGARAHQPSVAAPRGVTA